MDPSDRELLVRIDERTKDMHDDIKGAPGRPGLLGRVESLEHTRAYSTGFAAAVSAIISALFGWFINGHK